MLRLRRALLPALLASALAVGLACGPAATGKGANEPKSNKEALKGLPPRTDPPLALDDDDDLERARSQFALLPLSDQKREQRRRELWEAYRGHIEYALAEETPQRAFEHFAAAISLWAPSELADETKPVESLAPLVPTAESLYKVASRAGLDIQASMALTVLLAAEPARRAELEAAYDAIAAYADDLEVARYGPGAEGARPIRILEAVTAAFPSPWACRKLADLYIDRQARRVGSIGKLEERMEAAHGRAIGYPVWNVLRAYARMGRLDLVPDVIDSFAGQPGDEPEVRQLLRMAFAPGPQSKPEIFAAVAQEAARFTLGADNENDLITARRICEAGIDRHPKAPEPYRCAGLFAAQMGNLPLSVAQLETAYQIKPDQAVGDVLATLYHFQLSDYLTAERLQAAEQLLPQIEKFHADVQKRFPEPVERGLDDAYLIMGRGLYALGEIDDALEWLRKATKVKANAEALELIGLIELRRGQWQEAAKDFEASAALPRETPLEQRIDQARLLRLAAEARLGAGDRVGAENWFRLALGKWDEVLGAGLTERQRVEALTERGRLLWHLGLPAEALRSFEAAVDSAGDATQSSAFSDVIAFLYPRGHYAESLDAYHRGLARTGVTEYFKIYCSLWVVYAARMKGLEPDPLAMKFLKSRHGSRWYHDLARFASGEMTFEQLHAKATTRGKRAEAYYYQGLALYAKGDDAGGAKMMQWVLDTEMLGFFEYEMARYILEHGPPR